MEKNKLGKSKYFKESGAVAIPAFIFLFLACIVPMFYTVMMAFKDYNIARGIFGSPWVGLNNFTLPSYFTRNLANTLAVSVPSVVLGAVYVFLLTYGIGAVKNIWLKAAFTFIAAMPMLIDPMLISNFLIKELNFFFTDPAAYRYLMIANEVFRFAPLAVIAGAFACINNMNKRKVLAVTAVYALIRLAMLLISDINFILVTYNPIVYETGDVVGTFLYRKSLMEAMYSMSSANSIIILLLQIIPTVIGFAFFFKIIESPIKENRVELSAKGEDTGFATLIAAAIPLAIAFFVFRSAQGNTSVFSVPVIRDALRNSITISLITTVIGMVVSASLAYGVVIGNWFVRIGLVIMILFGDNLLGQFFLRRFLGIYNTIFPIISPVMVAVFTCMIVVAHGSNKSDFSSFLRRILPFIVTSAGLIFVYAFNNVVMPMVNIADRNLYPLSLVLREALMGGMSQSTIITDGSPRAEYSYVAILMITFIIGFISIFAGMLLARRKD